MWADFKKFIMRGNAIDMAVGVIIGAAFGAIVTSLVSDVLMPPVGLALGGIDFSNMFLLLKEGNPAGPYAALADAKAAGAVTINYGVLINAVISFLIMAAALFMLIRALMQLQRETPVPAAEPTTKVCPFCQSEIAIKATRCPHCTSQLSQ